MTRGQLELADVLQGSRPVPHHLRTGICSFSRFARTGSAWAVLLAIAFIGIPLFADEYWLSGILIPWLILSLVALGQNILMGYAGQLSLGSAGFMAVGAFACYNLILRIDGIPFFVAVALSGVCAAVVGIFFGLPSLRIRGLYLAVTTLAAQFFIVWALDKFGWFKNYDPAGVITAQPIVISGHDFTSPAEKYLVVLVIVATLTLAAKNMARGSVGRGWMAVRDMDVAAEAMGLSLLRTKLQAFAISSFYCGVGVRCSHLPIFKRWSLRPSPSICRSASCSWRSSAGSAPSWARSSAPVSSCCCRSS